MGYHIGDIGWTVVTRAMAVLGARMGQAPIGWEVHREALRIVNVPMENVEVVLLEHVQQVQDGGDGEELSPRVEHEASVRVLVGCRHPCAGFKRDRPQIAGRGVREGQLAQGTPYTQDQYEGRSGL